MSEALIAAVGLAGFFLLTWNGITLTVTGYLVVLAITAAFYAVLLLIRAIFTFMTGDSHFWWEKYEDRHEKRHDHDH